MKVAAQGIRRVSWQLVAHVSFYDSQRYNPNWSRSYASDYYAARISALTVALSTDYDSGTVILNYQPGKQGKRAVVSVIPAAAASYVKINNLTTTSSKGTYSTFCARRALGTNTITVSGRVPLGRTTAQRWITVDKPELLAAAVFCAELAKLKVTVAGSTKIMTTPKGKQKIIATDYSMPLAQLLVPFMKLPTTCTLKRSPSHGHHQETHRQLGRRSERDQDLPEEPGHTHDRHHVGGRLGVDPA